MKPSFVFLSIALLLLSFSDADDYVSPSQSPVMSPTSEPVMSPLQSPVMSPTSERTTSSDCSTVIYSMVDCLTFLTVGSTDPSPTKPCCVGIKTVLEYNPKCLCSALESSRAMGFDIDDTKALAMPSICHVPINPHCGAVATPPTLTPVSPSIKSPKTSPSSAKSPSKTPSSTTTETITIPKRTASSSKASSPSPSPSKSSSINLSVSRVFLFAFMVSSFVYISA